QKIVKKTYKKLLINRIFVLTMGKIVKISIFIKRLFICLSDGNSHFQAIVSPFMSAMERVQFGLLFFFTCKSPSIGLGDLDITLHRKWID
ncbi:MAG: hypothetical protein ACXVDJ_04465, partial [Tumebacillaceae bacterium]